MRPSFKSKIKKKSVLRLSYKGLYFIFNWLKPQNFMLKKTQTKCWEKWAQQFLSHTSRILTLPESFNGEAFFVVGCWQKVFNRIFPTAVHIIITLDETLGTLYQNYSKKVVWKVILYAFRYLMYQDIPLKAIFF